MKTKAFVASVLTALVVALPVHADTGDEADQDGAKNMESKQSMEKQWNETMKALGKYGADQRDQALETGRETLDIMDRRIERMEAWTTSHWDSLSEEARKKKTATLEAMRKQRRQVAEWYGGMKHSSADAWDSVKKGFIQSYGKLQDAYSNAVGAFGSDEEGDNSDSSD